ncbi:MAG TPA: hypothetical protein VK916_02165, partial [Gillisia sp.]|nr:hypothetical protein [Gillisia sp.]
MISSEGGRKVQERFRIFETFLILHPMEKPDFFINKPDNILPSGSTDEIFRKSDSLSFHQTIEDYKPTPLVELKSLAEKFGVKKIYVKDESFRFGLNAFKGLGASYAIHKLLEQNPSI